VAVSSAVAHPGGSTGRRPALLGVGTIIWLASELMFFSGLFAAYFTLRAQTPVWPPKDVNLDTATATIATILLVLSSGSMQRGLQAIERGDRRRLLGWLAITLALGGIFIGMQAWDWTRLHFGVESNAYGSAFYLMTGFHGLHVIAGLLAMLVIGARATSSRFGADDAPAVEMLSYYWHFVDAVWIALYGTIFFLK
jgi:cytochrome c oxidase subunit 3